MRRILWTLVVLAVSLTGCDILDSTQPAAPAKRQARLHGGGSSFVNPLMQQWCSDYQKQKDVKVNYQSLGSGAGIQYATLKTFDFGCTDAPLTDEQMRKAKEIGGDVIHIPLTMGAVVVAYNLPDVDQPLRFSPQVIADIFLGKIKKWNDPALKELNPKVTLPDQEIGVVHRQDSSGTTFVFTDYLTKVSPEWSQKLGAATSVKWPVGTAQKGNEGISAHVAKTPGSVGYMELTFALQQKLKTGLIQNREGVFIRPSLENVTATAVGALQEIREDLRYSLTNAPGKESYPICGTVWMVMYVDQKGDKGQALVDFARWALHDGQNVCEGLLYARLPEPLVQRAEKKLEQVKVSH